MPPGWQAVLPPHPATPAPAGNTPWSYNWQNRLCAGVWPGVPDMSGHGAQDIYAAGCYGHDEPGIQFYSALPGSGGNVSWNVTLPIDRSATLNQSNLYSAIWFGMALTDPVGWLHQCFLEVQFYPDQTFYNPGPMFPSATVNGAWIGAAVAWQIDAATGIENPCYYQPLFLNGHPGPAYLNMTQGDRINVVLTGSTTSTTGEQLSVVDMTNGQGSNLTLFDTAGGFPLNPAYSTNSYPAAFQWTPGGEYPVAFAYETGHAGNFNWPANNSFGGCSGGPKSTPIDPAAPCPSYDPGSWANDTLVPWHIDVPTFFNSYARQTPTQVAFTQPEGGMDLVDQTSNGVCNAVEGTEWCSYPWYSYSCSAQTFEFGATDYNGVSQDFGKYTQYDRVSQTSALGIPFFPPTNFSVPSCAGSNAVKVGSSIPAAGSAYFLSHDYATPTVVKHVSNGEYSLHAIASTGAYFSHWFTTGQVSVLDSTNPWTSLEVAGSGTVSAVFTTAPHWTTVTFKDVPHGFVGIDPTLWFSGTGKALTTVYNGGSFSLAPGIYPIQAYPKAGYNFTSWSWSGSGVTVAATAFPITWLIVDGSSSTATVTAHYKASGVSSTIILIVIGSGSTTVGPLTVTNSGPGSTSGNATVPVGTYSLKIYPTASTVGWQFLYGTSVDITNYAAWTYVTVENGTAVMEVIFTAGAGVTLDDSPAAAGSIAIVSPMVPGPALYPSGSHVHLALGNYTMEAVSAPGHLFQGWMTNHPSMVTFSSALSAWTTATIMGQATITAVYSSTSISGNLGFHATSGSMSVFQLDGMGSYHSGQTAHVSSGQHVVSVSASAGWVFAGWSASGSVIVGSASMSTTVVNVMGNGMVSAKFVPGVYPVTFVAWNPEGNYSPTETLTVNHHVYHQGETIWLSAGAHMIRLTTDDGLQTWTVTPFLGTSSSHTLTTMLFVHGAGAVYAILVDSDHGHDHDGPRGISGAHGLAAHGGAGTGVVWFRRA